MSLGSGEAKLEVAVSYLLVVGVIVSVVLEVIGIGLYFGAFGNVAVSTDPAVYISGDNFFSFIALEVQNLFTAENALVFMTLGIIVLLLTPYIRAITSVAYFAWEKNLKYVLITLFVLIVLTISLALH
ncbi:MAG: DUF1634 domain-containing protein [Candidatus Bathyarchaeota archaeon]|nr:DUF1634 domain-containing protein [Candidatus Bathyarchaeota archaeon]